jgi:hypothetical protein
VATRLRELSGAFHRGLASSAVEGDDLFWCFSSQTARVAIANLPGHLDRSNPIPEIA